MAETRSTRSIASRNPQLQSAGSQATNSGPVDIASLLKIIQQAPQQPQQPQLQPKQPLHAELTDLEKTFSQFRGHNQIQMSQIPQVPQIPQINHASSSQGLDLQKILAVMNAQKQMQQAPPLQSVSTTQSPNLASILSQISNPTTQQQQSQSYGIGQQHNQYYEDSERKRMREDSYDNYGDDGAGYNKRSRMNGDPGKPKKHVRNSTSSKYLMHLKLTSVVL